MLEKVFDKLEFVKLSGCINVGAGAFDGPLVRESRLRKRGVEGAAPYDVNS